MIEEDRVGFNECLERLSEIYPNQRELSTGALGLWFDALVRFELKDITAALTRHVNDPDVGQFFPKPADVVRNIEGSKLDRASIAWTTVDKAVRQVGSYASVCFDSAITNRVISDMGGWIELCKVTEKDWPFRENEFKKRYQAFVLNTPKEFPKYLIGISESHNKANNLPVDPPLLIGNQRKAQIVYQKGNVMKLEFKAVGEILPKQIAQSAA